MPPSSGGRSPSSSSGSGGGLGSGQGGSGGGSSGSGGDGDSGNEQQPERPHRFLWGRLLLLASAAVAAAEQLLEQPGRGSRLLAALALLGALLWQGQLIALATGCIPLGFELLGLKLKRYLLSSIGTCQVCSTVGLIKTAIPKVPK